MRSVQLGSLFRRMAVAAGRREELLGELLGDADRLVEGALGLFKQGRYAEAEPLFESAQAIREKALGPDHPDVAISLNNTAICYQVQGRFTDAELAFTRALKICEKA